MEEIPERLTVRPSWLITQLAVHARKLVFDGFTTVGARGYHYRILAALHEHGPASQAELGRRCRIDRSDVVAAVNELVAQGFVDRTPDPDHGRRNKVTLTDAASDSCAAWTRCSTGCRTTCSNRCRRRSGRP
ncbi:MarR family winged helix-turn-helix transcriptional regulator [Streptomyces nogalater]